MTSVVQAENQNEFTPAAFAALVQMSLRWTRYGIHNGQIKHVKRGRRYFIPASELSRLRRTNLPSFRKTSCRAGKAVR